MSSVGSLAARNPYGVGARSPIGSGARIGGTTGFGGAGINNRAGVGLNTTSLNRSSISNRSFAVNRTSNAFNSFNGNGNRNTTINSNRNTIVGGNVGGRNSYAGMHQGWLNGRWGGNGGYGGFGRGYGGYGGGWGYGGYGRGVGYGGYGGLGYGGYGLGYGGFGLGLGYGLGMGLGFGLGYGGFGLGYGLFGMGGGVRRIWWLRRLRWVWRIRRLRWLRRLRWVWRLRRLWPEFLELWTVALRLGLLELCQSVYYDSLGQNAVVVQQPVVYDYTQPINSLAAPPDPAVTSQVVTTFDSARAAFKAGDYPGALNLADQSIRQMPNDPALHEFRALVLFALQRYDEAASVLYAVLTAGPGWDWATMSGLYPSVAVYTDQLRALEGYCTQNPGSASARFVLAYHYLTEGHTLAALQQLKIVATLQPQDALSPQLARQFDPGPMAGAPAGPAAPAGTAAPAGPAGAASPLTPPPAPLQETSALVPNTPATGKEGRLEGTWTAQPDQNTTITLTFPDAGHFSWKVTHQGQSHVLQGKLNSGNGILTLAQDQGPAIVGNTTWHDETHFQFKVPGAGPNDPGLAFSKSN